MEKTKRYFDVTPLMVEAGRPAVVRIRPRFEQAAFPAADQLTVRVAPAFGALPDGRQVGFQWGEPTDPLECLGWKLLDDGSLEIRAVFAGEQEHLIYVEGPEQKPAWRFAVYSLEPDYYALRPFKGDFHIHTMRSDGLEAPEYVAARYREAGFDFAAISDHHHYEPSLEAIEFWRQQPTGLRLYPGEEVHAPDNPVHILNFGGRYSVNALFRQDEDAYRREVAARISELGEVAPGVNSFAVASSEWVFDQIRAAGGLAVFCHPYWSVKGQNVLPNALVDEIFRRRKFDALELIGGFGKADAQSNNFQVVRASEEWRTRGEFPVVGLSDSHGTDRGSLFGWYYTVVLAKSDELTDLIQGIKAGLSVAVEAPEGERAQCYGLWRLVRYASFLLREYFPRHQEICRLEGQLMIDLAGGDRSVAAALPLLGKRAADWRETAFRKLAE